MKQNVAATAMLLVPQWYLPKRRNRIMKPTRQSKTAAPESTKARSFAESSSSDELQWPPVEVPKRFRARRTVAITLPRRSSTKPHAVLGVNVATSPRGSTVLRPRSPVPFPSNRVPSPQHLLDVLVQAALGTETPAPVDTTTPVGALVTKIQSSDCSSFAAVDSSPPSAMIHGSEVSDVAAANTRLLQQNGKLHPVLGISVPTRRRS